MNTDIVSEISARFPPETVITQHEDLVAYSYDGTPILQQLPKVVVLVNSREDVATVLTLATKYGIPVVTRGSGTGLSGGSVPVEGSIVLCTTRMNHILELDTDNLTMMVEPGVINNDVAMRAEAVGLFYPPDPGSMKISTIGGNVSENSDGPAARKTLLAVYEQMDQAASTVSAIIAAKIIPCTMEFLDRTTIRCIENYSKVGLPLDCEAILSRAMGILLQSTRKPNAWGRLRENMARVRSLWQRISKRQPD
jgi:FAD/FMN-containing dehydrogenase